MRNFYLSVFLIAVTTLSVSSSALAIEEVVYKRYPAESGIIEYKISGDQTGQETVYFDHWGLREARYTETTGLGKENTAMVHTVIVMDGDWIYNFNVDTKMGSKIPNLWLRAVKASGKTGDLTSTYQDTLKSLGAMKSGTETLLEKSCDIWVNPNLGSTAWIWASIPLKIDYKTPALTIHIEATKLQENTPIADEKFQVPTDIKISEPSAAAKEALGVEKS